MRILLIAHTDVYGTGERTRNLVRNLKKEYKATLVTPEFSDKGEFPKNVMVKILPGNKILSVFKRCLFSLKEKYDIIHCFKPLVTSSLGGVLEKIIKNKPFILDWDDWEGSLGYAKDDNFLRRGIIDFSEFLIPRFADAITTVSPILKGRASKSARAFIVPNGVDVEEFKPDIRSTIKEEYRIKGNLVVFTGVLGKSTDVDMMIEAMKYVSDAKLMIVGDGPRRAELEEFARKIGVEDRIVWIGMQPKERIPKILSAADVALLPLKDNLQNNARHPIKLGEYLASGLPVVTNPVGICKRIIRDGKNGLLVKENAHSFADSINEILTNDTLKEKLSVNARKTVIETLDWKKIVPKLENIYQTLI